MTKKQGYSSIVCFITVCIVTIILLLNGFIIHAEEINSFSDAYNFNPSEQDILLYTLTNFQESDSYFAYKNLGVNPFYSGGGTYYQYFDNDTSNGEVTFDNSFDPAEFPYFFINGVGNTIVITCHNYYDSILWTSMCGEQPFDVWQCTFDLGTQTQSSWTYYEDQGSIYNYNGNYYYYLIRGTDYVNLYANTPMYLTTAESSLSGLANSGTFAHLEDKTSTGDYKDSNFNLNKYDSGGGSGGSMSEDIDKGLYMLKGSCIYLSNKSFNDGTLYINALLTDDQKNNPNLTIVAKGSCTYSFGYSGVTPSAPTIIYATGYSNQNSKKRVLNILWGDDANTLVSHEKTVNCDFGMLGSYPISVNYNSDNSGTNSIALSEVNNNMFTGDLSSGVMFRPSIGNMAAAYDSANASNFTVRNFNLNITKNVSVNTGFLDQNSQSTDVYLTDVRYHFELYMVENYGDSNADWSDIIYSYDVDMLRGTSSVGTDGTLTYDDLENNFDGDIPSEYLPSTDIDSSGGSSVSSSGGNNQVVTINGDDSAKYLPSLINKLLPSDSESDGGLSEDFQNIVNSNGWLSVIKYSFSFIPESFWDTMVVYFSAILGLLACAFLIRIILDLL